MTGAGDQKSEQREGEHPPPPPPCRPDLKPQKKVQPEARQALCPWPLVLGPWQVRGPATHDKGPA